VTITSLLLAHALENALLLQADLLRINNLLQESELMMAEENGMNQTRGDQRAGEISIGDAVCIAAEAENRQYHFIDTPVVVNELRQASEGY
jgi:hypothetical protein